MELYFLHPAKASSRILQHNTALAFHNRDDFFHKQSEQARGLAARALFLVGEL